MKVQIKMVISHDNLSQTTHDILCLERQELSMETLGLTLKESKALAAEVQSSLISAQIKNIQTSIDCAQAMVSLGAKKTIIR